MAKQSSRTRSLRAAEKAGLSLTPRARARLHPKTGWYQPGTRETYDGLPCGALKRFYADLDRLIAQHFEKDEDGDYPVSVDVWDRTYGPRPHILQLKHDHKNPTRERHLENVKIAASNVEMTASELNRSVRLLSWYEEEVKKANAKAKERARAQDNA